MGAFTYVHGGNFLPKKGIVFPFVERLVSPGEALALRGRAPHTHLRRRWAHLA